jgi:hypothetical protein
MTHDIKDENRIELQQLLVGEGYSDDHEEQCALIVSPRHREANAQNVRLNEELFGGSWELSRDKTGSEGITINSYMFDDEAGFVLDGKSRDDDIIYGRALAMRSDYEKMGMGDGVLADLKISVEELAKRILFLPPGLTEDEKLRLIDADQERQRLKTDHDATLRLLDVRNWIEAAVVAKGAKAGDVGIGCGQADIAIELDGHHYGLCIKEETT